MQQGIWRGFDTARRIIEKQSWLDAVSGAGQRTVGGLLAAMGEPGRRAANFLHGIWLGHPLHPVLTVLPLGSWYSSVMLDVLDLVGFRRFRPAADALLTAGVLTAPVTATAGIVDWHKTDEPARRYGVVHALLNTVSLSLFVVSMLQRRRNHRGKARMTSLAAMLVGTGSAYIGGDMSYRQRLGVNHSPIEFGPAEWTPIGPLAEFPQGASRYEGLEEPAAVIRRGDAVTVLADRCAHLGGPLSEGRIEGEGIVCPWHQSRFALDDGHPMDGPSAYAQPCLDVRIVNGLIEVKRGQRGS